MPKERFNNLPPEKQARVLEAAVAEMCRVPYNEVSINQIIKQADISRGSFYQYFEDKDDLLEFLLQDFRTGLANTLEKSFAANGGDAFAACADIFDYSVAYGMRDNNLPFFKNIFTNLRLQTLWPEEILQLLKEQPISEYYGRLVKENLRDASEENILTILDILLTLFHASIIQVFNDIDSHERTQKIFRQKLAIVKYGAVKEENA